MDVVNVTLLLAGGHRHQMGLPPGDPLLGKLVDCIREKSAGRKVEGAYHLTLDGGRQSLLFPGSDLIGLITEPPLFAAAPPAAPDRGQPELRQLVPSRHLLLRDFLPAGVNRDLLAYVARQQGNFVDSTVSTNDADYRRSQVLHHFGDFATLLKQAVLSAVPQVLPALGMAPFAMGEIEAQLTAHGDGAYFKLHNDSGSPDTVTRALTFVYYFHNEPKRWSGGQFRLYDSRIENGMYACAEPCALIEPENNSALFFASHCHHEVLPVTVPSGRFADNRFAVNGWVRRAA